MRFAVVRGCTAAEARLEPTNRAEQPHTSTAQPTHILDRSTARKNRGFGPFGGRSHLENHPNERISAHVLHGHLLPGTPPTGAFHARWRAEEAAVAPPIRIRSALSPVQRFYGAKSAVRACAGPGGCVRKQEASGGCRMPGAPRAPAAVLGPKTCNGSRDAPVP